MAENCGNKNKNPSTGTVSSDSSARIVSSDHSTPKKQSVSAPWAEIVRRDSEAMTAGSSSPKSSSSPVSVAEQAVAGPPAESVEDGSGSGNAGRRQAWSRPINGASEVGSIMDAQWPALSDAARVSSKTSPDSSKNLCNGSSSWPRAVSKGTGNASVSSQKQNSNTANSNSVQNLSIPARQRSMKRNGAGSSSNGVLSQPPPPGSVVEAPLQTSSRDHAQRGRFTPQPHGNNDHFQHHNSFRNRNSGSHPRGNGFHSQNYGGRRYQDHGNQDWNHQRNSNGRGAHMQPQRGFQMYFGNVPPPPSPPLPPHNSVPYMGGPFPGHFYFGLPGFSPQVYAATQAHPDPPRGVPYTASMPPVCFTTQQDNELRAKIVRQVDFYFSDINLVRDTFLRQNMDGQGWVPIEVIAKFNQVALLTGDIDLIVDALQSSDVVEVQDYKTRKQKDWSKWIMTASMRFPHASSPRSGESSSQGMLANGIQNISLNQKASSNQVGVSKQENVHAESSSRRSLSGDLNNEEDQVPNGDR